MESFEFARPHAVCIPLPAQGHIIPMMQLAKLLHSRGFYITFVNTEFNHRRLVRSRGLDAVKGLEDFRFETISDGMPSSDKDATQDPAALCSAILNNFLTPFKELVSRLNSEPALPHVTCIVADGVMSFGIKAAEELGIPGVQLWTASACGFMGYLSFSDLEKKGVVPFKDKSFPTDGTLEQNIDWIPGMPNIRLKDLPSMLRTTNPADVVFNYLKTEVPNCLKASTILINTFDDFEHCILDELKKQHSHIYTIGPLSDMFQQYVPESEFKSTNSSSLWKEDMKCLDWLNKREAGTVVYVNYGSVTTMSIDQLLEFAWGLADSNYPFLWVVRPDVVNGCSSELSVEFFDEIKDRGLVVSWCPQEQVLRHPSIGAFLTHCGWNSMLESVSAGVPLICWPDYSEQHTNCHYACTEWKIGLEISTNANRREISQVIKEIMEGEKGHYMRKNAKEWKKKAEAATRAGGSSYMTFNNFINEVLHLRN